MPSSLDWEILETQLKTLVAGHAFRDKREAFPYLVVGNILNLTKEEVADAITDASRDRGIDAFYFEDHDDEPTLHIFNLKFYDNQKNSAKSFPGREIDNIISMIADFCKRSQNLKSSCHPRLLSNVEYVWEKFTSPNFALRLYLVSNGSKLSDVDRQRLLDYRKQERFFDFAEYDLTDIVEKLIQTKEPPIDAEIQLFGDQHLLRDRLRKRIPLGAHS